MLAVAVASIRPAPARPSRSSARRGRSAARFGSPRCTLSASGGSDPRSVQGTALPRCFVRWVIENEWVSGLADLVERRLMLLFAPELSEASLRELAGLLVDAGKLSHDQVDVEVNSLKIQLGQRHGKRICLEPGD